MATESSVYSEILHLFGPLDDHKVLEILKLEPTNQELEIVASYHAGMTDVLGEERQPLSGKSARIYDIIRMDELLPEEER